MHAEPQGVSGWRIGFVVIVVLSGVCIAPTSAAERVVTIGDSWAYLIADYGSLQLMLDTFFPGQGYTAVNESFGGGTAGQMTSWLGDITAKINAHPSADFVYLSAGGNDFLLGQVGGGWYLDMSGEQAFFDTVRGYVQTVVNHILSIRPDIQIVIGGYDYVNMWDFDLSNGGEAQVFRYNYNLGFGGSGYIFIPPTFEIAQQQSVNAAFRSLESRKEDIADASRRVHYVENLGINNYVYGYDGYFGTWPAGAIWPDLPVTPDRLGSGGTDPIHLDDDGYDLVALQCYNHFFITALQSATLSLSTGTIDFGNVRIGTSGNGSVTASNAGPNFTKVKNLTWPVASGEFSGGGGTVNPLFKDPTLGSDTAGKTYTYAPGDNGPDSQGLTITSDSGSPGLTLTGTGVGPMFDSSAASLDFGEVGSGASPSLGLDITNDTSDPDLGNLTDLTLVSAVITGPDAGLFQLNGFTPGTVLSKGEVANLSVQFNASGPPGAKSATLTFNTDQGAAFGGSGDSFDVPLTGTVVQLYALDLAIVNPAWGTVELDPAPADPNAPQYAAGTPVTLTADPIDGKGFKQWEIYDPNHPGDVNYAVIDSNLSVQIVMDEDKGIAAVFKCGSGVEPLLPIGAILAGVCIVTSRRTRRRR